MHKCRIKRCFKCSRYILKEKLYDATYQFCNDFYLNKPYLKQCQKCLKEFKTIDCFESHLLNTCKIYSLCNLCNKFFRKANNHICGSRFCRLCFTIHTIGSNCFIKPCISFKCNKGVFCFLHIFYDDQDNPISIFLCNIINENKNTLNVLYSYPLFETKIQEENFFYQNCTFSKEIDVQDMMNNFINFLTIDSNKKNKISIIAYPKILCTLLHFLGQTKITIINNTNFTFQNLFFKDISGFLNLPTTVIANKLKKNACLAIIPKKIIENYYKNDIYQFDKKDFDLLHCIGSDQFDSTCFKNALQNIECILFNKKYVSIFIGLCLNQLHLNSLMLDLLNTTFTNICNKTHLICDKFVNLYNYYSLTNASYDIFLSTIPAQKLSIMCPNGRRSFKNSSRIEIIMCQILSNFHRKRCNSKPVRYVGNVNLITRVNI